MRSEYERHDQVRATRLINRRESIWEKGRRRREMAEALDSPPSIFPAPCIVWLAVMARCFARRMQSRLGPGDGSHHDSGIAARESYSVIVAMLNISLVLYISVLLTPGHFFQGKSSELLDVLLAGLLGPLFLNKSHDLFFKKKPGSRMGDPCCDSLYCICDYPISTRRTASCLVLVLTCGRRFGVQMQMVRLNMFYFCIAVLFIAYRSNRWAQKMATVWNAEAAN